MQLPYLRFLHSQNFLYFLPNGERVVEITEDIQPMVHGNNNDITELA